MLNASDIMTTDVITVKKETNLKDLARLLYRNHINGVPVVDDDGLLIGIICESDLIRKDKKLHIPTVVAIFDWVLYLESPKRDPANQCHDSRRPLHKGGRYCGRKDACG